MCAWRGNIHINLRFIEICKIQLGFARFLKNWFNYSHNSIMDFWSLEGPRRYDAKLSKPLVGKLRGSAGLFYTKKKEMNFLSVWKVL